MNIIKCCLILTVCLGFAAACGQTSPVPNTTNAVTNAVTTTNTNKPPEIAVTTGVAPDDEAVAGKELYAMNCMICHKDSGKGGKVTIDGKSLSVDDLTSEKIKKFTDEKIYGYIRDGVIDEGMPAFKDKLKESEMKAVVAHVRLLQKGS